MIYPISLVEPYRGIILVRTSRLWEKAYIAKLPLFREQPLDVLESILADYFEDKYVHDVDDLYSSLRSGGFVIPFLKRMKAHFIYVAKSTQTPLSIPLQLTVREWAFYWLIDCYPPIFAKSDKKTEDTMHQAEDDRSLRQSKPRQEPRKSGRPKDSSKGKQVAKDTPSISSGSTSSSSSNPTGPISSKYPEVHVKLESYLKTVDGDEEIIWKGVTSQDLDSFHRTGGWYREIRRRGGDLSVAAAIYYTDDQRYALAWAAYRIRPSSWKSRSLAGAIIFEAKLIPTQLSRLDLVDSDSVQDWMITNFESLDPALRMRTPPPNSEKSDWDIVSGPLRKIDVEDDDRLLYMVTGLTKERLQRTRQIAFCTENAVAYVNACHTRVIVIDDEE